MKLKLSKTTAEVRKMIIAFNNVLLAIGPLPVSSRRRVIAAAQVLIEPSLKPLSARTTRAGKQDKPKPR